MPIALPSLHLHAPDSPRHAWIDSGYLDRFTTITFVALPAVPSSPVRISHEALAKEEVQCIPYAHSDKDLHAAPVK